MAQHQLNQLNILLKYDNLIHDNYNAVLHKLFQYNKTNELNH